MGHVAGGDNCQQELRSQQKRDSSVLMVPTTPESTSEVRMNEKDDKKSYDNEATKAASPSPDHQQDRAPDTNTNTNTNDEDAVATAHRRTATDDLEDPYADLDPNTTLVIPITNPSAFPIQRLQEVQAQRQPSTHIANMWCHKTPSGPITQVTADIQDGSINHLVIRDERWLSALGLGAPDFDTLEFDATKLRLDETFTIAIFPGQRAQKLDDWVMGELVGARHAYLFWLDERGSADPKAAPFAAEAKAIARKTGRRWPDVMAEIERVWKLETGSRGREYRENRGKYLGENPSYPAGAEEGRVVRSMFG